MTVIQGGSPACYMSTMWSEQAGDLIDGKPLYLPTLVTKSYAHIKHPTESVNSMGHATFSEHDRQTLGHHKGFKNRIKLGIFKGRSQTIASDPESHLQLVKEKQALYEHRVRPKSPISLQPVHVLSLSKHSSKSQIHKAKNQRLSRSAPEPVDARVANHELSPPVQTTSWRSENQLQLPLLTRDSNVGLSTILQSNTSVKPTVSSGSSTNYNYPTHPSHVTQSPEPKLQIISSSRKSKLFSAKENRTVKPFSQAVRNSQSNYSALREQKLLTDKLRAYESETLTVSAQSCHQKDVENILEMVADAQSQLRCAKHNGRRSCGICPPTAGVVRKGRADSAQLPELSTPRADLTDRSRKELIVQLPHITYSRANTPAAGSNIGDRSTVVSAVRHRRTNNTPAVYDFSVGQQAADLMLL